MALVFLLALGLLPVRGQNAVRGSFDRIEVRISTTFFPPAETPILLTSPSAALNISASKFENGQIISAGDFATFTGPVRFEFPANTPDLDSAGRLKAPLTGSVSVVGNWNSTNPDSRHAAEVEMSFCGEISKVQSGPPMPTGSYPVSLSAACDQIELVSTIGPDPNANYVKATGLIIFETGNGDPANARPIFGTSALVSVRVVYKMPPQPKGEVTPTSLEFKHPFGQTTQPAAQTITLENSGGLPLEWTARPGALTQGDNWLKVSPAAGSLPGQESTELSVSVDPTGLDVGEYFWGIILEGNFSIYRSVLVKLTISPATGTLEVTPASVEFLNTTGLFHTQDFILSNPGPLPLSYSAETTTSSGGDEWLRIARVSAGSAGTVNPGQSATVTVVVLGLFVQDPGEYNGILRIRPQSTSIFPPIEAAITYKVIVERDVLKIEPSTLLPSPGKIKQEVENQFAAVVTYKLTTSSDADLALRAFDENGVLQGSSEFTRVTRSTTEESVRLEINNLRITADDNGNYPKKLILKAVLINRTLATPILQTPESAFVYDVVPRAYLQGLEVVQVVQNWNNSVPLVSGKATYVRAHLHSTDDSPSTIEKAGLRGFLGPNELSAEPLTPLNPGGIIEAQPASAADRSNWSQSLNFRLPENWTQGDLRLVFQSPGVECQESAGTPNDCAVSVTFQAAPSLLVKFVGVEWTDESNVTHSEPEASEADEEARKLLAMFPIARMKRGREYVSGFLRLNSPAAIDFDSLLNDLLINRAGDSGSETFDSARIYCGLINELPAFSTGGVLGKAHLSGDVAAGGVQVGADLDYVLPHEIAHNLGRPHPADGTLPLIGEGENQRKQGRCSETAAATADDFPYFETVDGNIRPTLGPLTKGENEIVYGLDTDLSRGTEPRVTVWTPTRCSS